MIIISIMNYLFVFVCFVSGYHFIVEGRYIRNNATYWQQREALLEEDYSMLIGRNLTLNAAEQIVDNLLKEAITKEIEDGISNQNFPPSKNFLLNETKSAIEASEVFSLIKNMPKGAALHVHDTALTSVDYVISVLTYWDNLYICFVDAYPIFRFSQGYPTKNCVSNWTLVADERAAYSSDGEFDEMLYKQITINVDDPHTVYPDIDAVWRRFGHYFDAINGIYEFRPAFISYLTRAMTEFMEDKVTYFEFRGTLPTMYELDGSELDPIEAMQVYEDTINNFTATYGAEFYGTRFIYGPYRRVPKEVVADYVALAGTLREKFPDTVAGFDLVGQEDQGYPLTDFIDPLLDLQNLNVDIPVFFHSGETNWYGISTDENIADALLLNSTRLGHGYAIAKHPVLMKMAVENDVPVEISPISNQVLKLVEDLRNHPATTFVTKNIPLVISSDDPAGWGALPLSHDFYEALMAFAGAKGDLKFLKQLALNSIKYSSLSVPRKIALQTLWQQQWDDYINRTVTELVYNKFSYSSRWNF